MSIDRKRLLENRQKALAALRSPDLPDDVKAAYKKALDLGEVALGLDDAIKRKQAAASKAEGRR